MPRLIVINFDGKRRELDIPVGKSVMLGIRENGYDLEGTCEGSLACATCHVHVDEAWFTKLESRTEDEIDMLDFAEDPSATSRLSCQIVMSDDLDGLIVNIPPTP